jgi:autotransporter-associated beta strand protein
MSLLKFFSSSHHARRRQQVRQQNTVARRRMLVETLEVRTVLAGSDAFATAFEIPGNVTTLSDVTDTFSYTLEAGEPATTLPSNPVGQTSAWWKLQASFAGTVQIDTYETHYPLNQCCGPDFGGFGDTTLEVFTGTQLNNLTLVTNNDDISALPGGDAAYPYPSGNPQGYNPNSLVTFAVTPGQTYYIRLNGWGDDFTTDPVGGGDRGPTQFNYKFSPDVVYVDDGFVGLNSGDAIVDADQGTGGDQPATFNFNAFATVSAAIAAASSSGTIVVNGGAYVESAALTNPQTLRIGGPDAAQAVNLGSLATAAGSTVNLAGASVLSVGDATSTTIAGEITGSGDLSKTGSGKLILTGNNSYTGTTNVLAGTLQAGASISTNLVALYDFSNPDNLGHDASGNNNDGTLQGGAVAAAGGVSGGALALPAGANGFVQMPNLAALFGGQAATFSMWTKLNVATPTNSAWTGFANLGSGSNDHYPWVDGTTYQNIFRNNSRVDSIPLDPGIDRTQWHLVTIVSDPTDAINGWRMYQNGTLIKSTAPAFGISGFQIGQQNNYFLNGLIDEARLYNRALTTAEVQGLASRDPNLNALPDNSPVIISVGATLALEGNETIGSLAGMGTVNLTSNTLTVGGDNASTIYGGSIIGGGGLTKIGSGALTLSGNNTYTGVTHVNAGTLDIGATGALPAMPGIFEWFDAADASTITETGGAISQWRDKAGGGRDLNQGTAGAQPTLVPDVANGHSVVRFDGNDVIFNPAANNSPGTPYTVLSVARMEGSKNLRLITSNNNWLLGFWGNGMDQFYADGAVRLAGSNPVPDTALHFYGAQGTGSVSTFFDGNRFIAQGSGGLSSPSGISLGAWQGNPANEASRGDVAELLIFQGILTPAQLAEVYAYLQSKWNSGGNVLSDSAGIIVAAGANVNVNVAETIGDLSGAGTITLNRALAVNETGNSTFSGQLQGAGGLTKTGAGTLTLSGANAYTGETNVNFGVLVATHNSALGSASAGTEVRPGGTLALRSVTTDLTITEPIVANGPGAAGQLGALVNLRGNNTLNAATPLSTPLVAGSQLAIGAVNDPGTAGVDTLTIGPSGIDLVHGKLVVNGDGDTVVNGPILGYAGQTLTTDSLANLDNVGDGFYTFTAAGQQFTGYVDNDGASSWLLIGRGRNGWQFDADGQGSISSVSQNLGTTAAFAPAAYSDALVNELIAQAGINNTGIELRIRRATDSAGTAYQEGRWRNFTGPNFTFDFDQGSGLPVEMEIISGAGSPYGPVATNTRDTLPPTGNDISRIFTWPWANHGNQQGFSYGSSIDAGTNNDPNNFLWELNNENHAIPYTEVYLRATNVTAWPRDNSVYKTGAGTLTLNSGGDNYADGTTISQGTLIIGHHNALGSGPVAINDANTGAANTSLLANYAGQTPIPNNISVTNNGSGVSTIGSLPAVVSLPGFQVVEYGGTLTLNKATTLQGQNADRTTYRNVISGNVGTLTVTGGRRTTIEANNTFVGNVVITGAGTTLQIGGQAASQIPDASNVDVGAGTFLTLNNDGEAINGLTGSGTIQNIVGGNTLTLGAGAGGTFTFSGSFADGSGPLTLVKTGSTIQYITGASTYTGLTTINGGYLVARNDRALGSTASGTVVTNPGTLQLESLGGVDIHIVGEAITISGFGVGGTRGALASWSGNNTFDGPITIAGNTSMFVQGNNFTLPGVIQGPAGFTNSKVGPGELTYSGGASNTFTGTTILNQGNLYLGKTGGAIAIAGPMQMGGGNTNQPNLRMLAADQFAPGVVMSLGAGQNPHARFDLQGFNQTLAGINSPTPYLVVQNERFGGGGTSQAATLTLNGSGNYAFAGYLRDEDDSGTTYKLNLVKSGAGTQSLSGNNINYTGATTITSGTLQLVDTRAFRSPLTINTPGVLELNSSTPFATRWNYGQTISGNGTINKTGAGGVFGIIGANNFSGQINIKQGTIHNDNLTGNWTGSTADVDISSGATLDLRGNNVTIDALTGAGSVINSYGNGTNILTLGVANGSGTFTGTIGGSGSGAAGEGNGRTALVKTGTGTQVLTAANTFVGTTQVTGGGVLEVADLGAIGQGTGGNWFAVQGGATFRYTGSTTQTTTPRDIYWNSGAATFDITSPTGAAVFNATGGDRNQTMTKLGPGRLTLASSTAANLLTSGTINLNAGSLEFQPNSPSTTLSILGPVNGAAGTNIFITGSGIVRNDYLTANWNANLASLNVAAGATFDLRGNNVTVDALNGDGAIINSYYRANNGLEGETLTVGAANGSGAFGGSISGSSTVDAGPNGRISLTKIGSGTQLFNGASTFTGPTLVTAGTLGGNGSLVSAVTVYSGATLAPGGTPGNFATGDVAFQPGSHFQVEITSGGSDQLQVTGGVNINGATLDATSAAAAPGQTYVIISNNGSDATVGAFTNALPDPNNPASGDQIIILGGQRFYLTYNDPLGRFGTGNDVALIRNTPATAVDDDFGPILTNAVYADSVKTNDIDPDNDGIVSILSGPSHGTVQLLDPLTGEFRYTPATDFLGVDTFTYQLFDGEFTTTATVTLTVARYVVDGDDLYVGGTDRSDRIIVSSDGSIRFNNAPLPIAWPGGRLVVYGNGGNDTISTSSVRFPVEFYGGAGNDYLAGGTSDDILDGGDGNDRLLGGSGDDILLGGSGDDRISGGSGDDYAFGDHMVDPAVQELFVFSLNNGADEVELPIRVGDRPGRDTINGDNDNDTLDGGPNNDRLTGGNGDDLIRGGDGNDRLDGGNGDDFLLGEGGADLLYGRSGNDILLGGGGLDSLYGGNEDDLLFGGDLFEGNTDDDLQDLWMLWRSSGANDDPNAAGSAFDVLEDLFGDYDFLGDTLTGERGDDWYAMFQNDRFRTSSEAKLPNEFRSYPAP